MVNYGVVGDVCQWMIPPDEPTPAQLVTGGVQRSLGTSTSEEVKMHDSRLVRGADKVLAGARQQANKHPRLGFCHFKCYVIQRHCHITKFQ